MSYEFLIAAITYAISASLLIYSLWSQSYVTASIFFSLVVGRLMFFDSASLSIILEQSHSELPAAEHLVLMSSLFTIFMLLGVMSNKYFPLCKWCDNIYPQKYRKSLLPHLFVSLILLICTCLLFIGVATNSFSLLSFSYLQRSATDTISSQRIFSSLVYIVYYIVFPYLSPFLLFFFYNHSLFPYGVRLRRYSAVLLCIVPLLDVLNGRRSSLIILLLVFVYLKLSRYVFMRPKVVSHLKIPKLSLVIFILLILLLIPSAIISEYLNFLRAGNILQYRLLDFADMSTSPVSFALRILRGESDYRITNYYSYISILTNYGMADYIFLPILFYPILSLPVVGASLVSLIGILPIYPLHDYFSSLPGAASTLAYTSSGAFTAVTDTQALLRGHGFGSSLIFDLQLLGSWPASIAISFALGILVRSIYISWFKSQAPPIFSNTSYALSPSLSNCFALMYFAYCIPTIFKSSYFVFAYPLYFYVLLLVCKNLDSRA
jgi:hypothetical protein